jgi:hypothetical protein
MVYPQIARRATKKRPFPAADEMVEQSPCKKTAASDDYVL